MKRSLLVVLSVLLFFLFLYVVKGEKGNRPDTLQKGESYIEGLRLVHRLDGSADWELTARRADINDKGDKAYLSKIEMKINNKGMTLYADKGTYDMTEKRLSVEGEVTAKGENYSIVSERVSFDGAGGALKTDGGVKIEAKKFSVQGVGMDAGDNGQKIRILKDVKAVFYN